MTTNIIPTFLHLKLSILNGFELVSMDRNALSDPYVTVKYKDTLLHRTHVCNATLNPSWDGETVTIDRIAPSNINNILIEVWDKDKLSQDKSMGSFTLSISSNINLGAAVPYYTEKVKLNGVAGGSLLIGLELHPVHVKLEGHLQKRGHALSLKKRYLVLYDAPETELCAYKDELCCGARFHIPLSCKGDRVEEFECLSRGPCMFMLRTPPANDRIFRCDTNDKSDQWVKIINVALTEAKKAMADSFGIGLSSIHSSIVGAAASQFQTNSQVGTTPKRRSLLSLLKRSGSHSKCSSASAATTTQQRTKQPETPRQGETKSGPKHPFFGLSIETLAERGEFGPNKNTLPPILDYLFKDIRARCMDVEGIFRVSGSHGCVAGAQARYEESGSVDGMLRPQDLPHVTSSLIKLFFRALPEPVIPFSLYQSFVDAVSQEDETRVLKDFRELIKDKLPIPNKTLLSNLIWLLQEIVAGHVETTQMTASNFGIVFGPSLLWTKDQDALALLKDTKAITAVIEFFIENCDALFGPAPTAKIASSLTSTLTKTSSTNSLEQQPPPAAAAAGASEQQGSIEQSSSISFSLLTSSRRRAMFGPGQRRPDIDYATVFAAVDKATPEAVAEQAQRLFHAYDFDGTGRLNLDEFVAFFIDFIQHAHLDSFSREDIRLLMETVSEGDMLITIDQFLVWWSDISFSINNQMDGQSFSLKRYSESYSKHGSDGNHSHSVSLDPSTLSAAGIGSSPLVKPQPTSSSSSPPLSLPAEAVSSSPSPPALPPDACGPSLSPSSPSTVPVGLQPPPSKPLPTAPAPQKPLPQSPRKPLPTPGTCAPPQQQQPFSPPTTLPAFFGAPAPMESSAPTSAPENLPTVFVSS